MPLNKETQPKQNKPRLCIGVSVGTFPFLVLLFTFIILLAIPSVHKEHMLDWFTMKIYML